MGKALRNYARERYIDNLSNYNFYYRELMKIVTNLFTWNNLPDGISARFIEEKLFFDGQVIFFKSKLGFYVVSRCQPIGFNDYEEPTAYKAYGVNKINEIKKASECIPIWNNNFRLGNAQAVRFYANKLSEIEKTISVNLEQMKNPYIVQCPQGQLETVKEIFSKKQDGVPYIVADKDTMKDISINVFNLDIKNFTKELYEIKTNYKNEALTHFGVNNVDINKKERLITGEANANNEQISINKEAMLLTRRKAANEINKKFGFNIEVDYNTENEVSENDK